MYHHIKRDDRVALAALTRAGHSQASCARERGVHRSTISRERRRNAEQDSSYDARRADKRARERRALSKKASRTIDGHLMRSGIIRALIKARYSPEQVAGTFGISTHTTIYTWIRRTHPELRQYLRRKGKKRRRYGLAEVPSRYQAAKRSIEERPVRVATRATVGDWEGDTARGGDRKSALVVHTERKSGFLVATPVARATSDTVYAEAVRALKSLPVTTITYDNGSEFALHKLIEESLGASVYFAHPHHPWERGTCENSIGLLREFFPKGTRFDIIRTSDLAKAVWNINHRPRKRLSWSTPCQVFGYCCA